MQTYVKMLPKDHALRLGEELIVVSACAKTIG